MPLGGSRQQQLRGLGDLRQAALRVLHAQIHLAAYQHQQQRRLRPYLPALTFHDVEQLGHHRRMDPALRGLHALRHHRKVLSKRGRQARPGHLFKHGQPAHFLGQAGIHRGLQGVGDGVVGIALQGLLQGAVEHHHRRVRVHPQVGAPPQLQAAHIVTRWVATFQPPRVAIQVAPQVKMPVHRLRHHRQALGGRPTHHLLVGHGPCGIRATGQMQRFAKTVKHGDSKPKASRKSRMQALLGASAAAANRRNAFCDLVHHAGRAKRRTAGAATAHAHGHCTAPEQPRRIHFWRSEQPTCSSL